MTAKEIIEQLKSLGSESIKKILMKHGAREPFYGVKVEELKKIQKKVRMDHKLSLELYDSGISDAMYLAGLISDGSKMTKKEIQKWADNAYWYMLSEYTVPWAAAESRYAWELAQEWIDSTTEQLQSTGWSTLSALLSVMPNEEIDPKKIRSLLQRVGKEIHNAANRTKYGMNGFVIAVGSFMPLLSDEAVTTAKKMGIIMVDVGGTACKVPFAADYIKKVKEKGMIGKKRKTVKC